MGIRDRIETDLTKVWRQWSTWVIAAVLFFGDIYNELAGLVGYADIPPGAKHALYALGAAGIAAKHFKQRPPTPPAGKP